MIRTALIGTAAVGALVGVGTLSYHAGATGAAALPVSQPEEMEMDPMIAAMMKAGEPGEPHARLASAAGEWKAQTKFTMQPGEPVEGEGTMYTKSIMDGRYTTAWFKSEFMGEPFEGMAINGYDNVTEEYFSIWIDSMSTGVMHMTGKMEGDTLTLHGSASMPQPMGTVEMKMISTFVDDNTMHDEFYKKIEGEWVKDGEITYTRVAHGMADD